MRPSRWPLLLALVVATFVVRAQEPAPLTLPEEKHLRNPRQLTFAGENAEAYFSADGKWLIYQSAGEGVPCDQIFIVPVDQSRVVNWS